MTRRTAAAVAVAAAVSLAVAPASMGARLAVGIASGADRETVERRLADAGATDISDLRPIPALAVTAPAAAPLRKIVGVRYVEVLGSRREAFVPNDPLFDRQWYATQNRAFDAWTELPPLAPVRVAVIDSGIDGAHPELQTKVAVARSFVGGSPKVDIQGHGTFVAGLIAAEVGDGIGIAGLAPPAELVVAKVVGPERSIPVEAEAKAIRWAVASGARVINMSLGGLRDPQDAGPGYLFTARGRRRCLRGAKGRARRGGRRQLRPVPVPALALCELAGGTPARPRRQRSRPPGAIAAVLEPRCTVQRHCGAGCGDPLDLPTRAHRAVPGLRRAGLFELRPSRVPRRRGDELRRAAGDRRGRNAARHDARARAGPGRCAAAAGRRRQRPCERLPRVHRWARSLHRSRPARPDGGPGAARRRASPS